jgi:chromosome segregation ATPase
MSEMEERLTRLEGEVADLRDRLELTRQVAGLQDSDLADIRLTLTAQTRLLQALADVQSQQTRTLGDLRHDLATHSTALQQHGGHLDSIRGGLQALTSMVQILIDREEPT